MQSGTLVESDGTRRTFGCENRLRVLIVEDEWLAAHDAQDLLEANGHVIIGIATDTVTALAIAANHVPELALVGLYLHDGRTGPAIARQLMGRHGTRCCYMTGHALG